MLRFTGGIAMPFSQSFARWPTTGDAMEEIVETVGERSQHEALISLLIHYGGLKDMLANDMLADGLFRSDHTGEYAQLLVGLAKTLSNDLGEQLVLSLTRSIITHTIAGQVSSTSLAHALAAVMLANKALKQHIYGQVFVSQFELLDGMHEALGSIDNVGA